MAADGVAWQVRGTPIPQGSMALVRGRLLDHQQLAGNLTHWRELVGLTGLAAFRKALVPTPLQGPVAVRILFQLPRPRTPLPPGREGLPCVRPDLDKLTRAVLDALQLRGLLVDDGQVCALQVGKAYGETSPRSPTTIGVSPIRNLDAWTWG